MPMPRPSDTSSHRPSLRLAASRGRRLYPSCLALGPTNAAELPMEVQFEGLSDAEQQRALASFPGGRRFVLASGR
jgi:hypothetical protein